MKAVVKYASGPKNVAIRDVSEPKAGKGEVKIKIKYVGVCGTDLHIYHDHYPSRPPVILGHEFSGVIVDIGEDVLSLKVSDRVTCEPFASVCGTCLNCKTGNPNLCLKRLSAGSGLDGAMTSYCVMPEERVHIIPDNVSLKEGALAEPLACCVHGVVDSKKIKPGDLVVVSGPGVIGLLSLQLAKSSGATVILFGTEKDKQRLDLGSSLGADYILDNNSDLKTLVRELTGDFGADVIIECAGHEKSLTQAMEIIRKGGAILQMGLFGEKINVEFDHVIMKEISLLGTFASNWNSWIRALKLISLKKVNVEPLIGCTLPLESWHEAFTRSESGEVLKVLLMP